MLSSDRTPDALFLHHLFPDLSALLDLFQTGILTGPALSAIFVIVLVIMLVVCTALTYRMGIRPTAEVVNILSGDILQGLTPGNVHERRDSLKHSSRDCGSKLVEQLWGEFDESLVQRTLDDGKKQVCNTLEAAHFFNLHSLSQGHMDSRLIAAIPGIFTGIGVLGTFMALTLGLGGITLMEGGADGGRSFASSTTQAASIEQMIAGASVAFITSFWGILCSLLFSAFEKGMDQRLKREITQIQRNIDYCFPRIRPEQSLVRMERSSHHIKESVEGMADRIGQQIRESHQETAKTIGDAIDNAMTRLTEAFDSMSGKHESMASQMQALGQGLDQLQKSVSALTEELPKTFTSIKNEQKSFRDDLADLLRSHQDRIKEDIDQIAQATDNYLTEYTATVQRATSERLNAWDDETRKFCEAMADTVETLRSVVDEIDALAAPPGTRKGQKVRQ